jgi:hypothetical protein
MLTMGSTLTLRFSASSEMMLPKSTLTWSQLTCIKKSSSGKHLNFLDKNGNRQKTINIMLIFK